MLGEWVGGWFGVGGWLSERHMQDGHRHRVVRPCTKRDGQGKRATAVYGLHRLLPFRVGEGGRRVPTGEERMKRKGGREKNIRAQSYLRAPRAPEDKVCCRNRGHFCCMSLQES